MEGPLFSVVIPTYNRAARLRQAIESVLVQDCPDWELVIVDDGSTDETEAVGTVYQQSDDRIRYFYQRNRQLNGARNTGVRMARGRYVCFLDDDDYFLANHLGLLSEYLDENSTIVRSGQLLEKEGKRIRLPLYSNGEDVLRQYWAMPVGPFGMTIRRDILEAHPFAEELLLLDDFVWLNQVLMAYPLYQIDDHSVVVRYHVGQRSQQYLDQELLEKNVSVLRAAYALPGVARRVPRALLHRQIVHQHTHLARQLNRSGHKAEAGRVLARASGQAGLGQVGDLLRTAGAILLR